MYHVVIVEDDPMVSSINKHYVDITELFQVDQCFRSGEEALQYFRTRDADLIILDYYMGTMNGDAFIDKLHEMGKTPSIIMVTSANDLDIVYSLKNRGILDYLVKPFEYTRFQGALIKYDKLREKMKKQGAVVNQDFVDQLISGGSKAETGQIQLAKGLNKGTLEMIRNFIQENPGEYTSEQLAELVHLSRITVRRYLNYMVDIHELVSVIDYQTGGRPSIKYKVT